MALVTLARLSDSGAGRGLSRQYAALVRAGANAATSGAKVVAVTLEKGLLKRVDDYAKAHEMKRAEMITKGLLLVMGHPD